MIYDTPPSLRRHYRLTDAQLADQHATLRRAITTPCVDILDAVERATLCDEFCRVVREQHRREGSRLCR